ncbi:MAG TPA: hypothetical protein VK452_05830 [Dissulfurispiraceae bacterium]|nr:hypothetical protein [Dissulfurispiraceae bacterium]
MQIESIISIALDDLFVSYPHARDFFLHLGICEIDSHLSAYQLIEGLPDTSLEDCGLDRTQMLGHFSEFVLGMESIRNSSKHKLDSLTIIGGYDKDGKPETAGRPCAPVMLSL